MSRKALIEAVQHIANNGTGRRRDDADDLRQKRTRLLAGFIKQAFGSKLALALFEQRHQSAGTRRFQRFDHDLIFGRARERRDLALGNDLHALFRLEAQAAKDALPDHGLDFGFVVLEREITVPGAMRAAIARDFTLQADITKAVLQRALDGA